MQDPALKLIRALPDDAHVVLFARRLAEWLLAELSEGEDDAFTESRAKALLRATDATDDPTLHDFARRVDDPAGRRVALYDLLQRSDLAEEQDVASLVAGAAQAPAPDEPAPIPWLTLAATAFAWQRQYPVHQLDPASPPGRYSPAGQIVTHTAHFLRQQVQRSATDRDKLAQELAPRPGDGARRLEELQGDGPIAPLPPHFRPPVPVRYPEVSRDTVQVEPDEETPQQPLTRGEPITITEEDLPEDEERLNVEAPEAPEEGPQQPVRMPPISISREQVEPPSPPSPLPSSGVVMPNASRSTSSDRPGLTLALRQMFRQEELKSTKLRVVVQEVPDGPGVYGLQVRVTCKGIKSHVAGTTNREGHFVAELPVRVSEGLTYDVDVTWPRDLGGETERKSITLNADRTEFKLPFYHQLNSTE